MGIYKRLVQQISGIATMVYLMTTPVGASKLYTEHIDPRIAYFESNFVQGDTPWGGKCYRLESYDLETNLLMYYGIIFEVEGGKVTGYITDLFKERIYKVEEPSADDFLYGLSDPEWSVWQMVVPEIDELAEIVCTTWDEKPGHTDGERVNSGSY